MKELKELNIRSLPEFDNHKIVMMIHEQNTRLYGFIAIHNDTLGPALGGTRMYQYQDDLAAIKDVLRLSRAMTYKAAMAGLRFGGGKAVLIGDPRNKTEEYLRAYAKRINYLGGAFITAEDVGFTVADIEIMAKETSYVTGRSEGLHDGIRGSGDPSPITAIGVIYGIRAALETVFGNSEIRGKVFAVQGLGKVGFRLCRLLYEQGAKLIVSDIDEHMVERALTEFRGAVACNPEEIYKQKVDVFSPCALGGILNDQTIPELNCKIVAGAANNQLAYSRNGEDLHKLGILYAPDYVINAGGLINVADELERGYNRERVLRKVARIYDNLKIIFEKSLRLDVPTNIVADQIVEDILKAAENLKRIQKL